MHAKGCIININTYIQPLNANAKSQTRKSMKINMICTVHCIYPATEHAKRYISYNHAATHSEHMQYYSKGCQYTRSNSLKVSTGPVPYFSTKPVLRPPPPQFVGGCHCDTCTIIWWLTPNPQPPPPPPTGQ